MASKIDYFGENSVRGPSGGVWANCPWRDAEWDPNIGVHFWDDFHAVGVTGAGPGAWNIAGTGGSFVGAASATFGAIGVGALTTGASDNNECTISNGNKLCPVAVISAGKRTWYESRIRCTSVAAQGLLIGLVEDGYTAADLMQDAGGVESVDYIGFRVPEGTPTQIDCVYNTAGVGEVVAQAGTVSATQQTLAANTWTKLGMYFDGEFMRWYRDGVTIKTAAGEDLKVRYSATGFPNDLVLLAAFAIKNADANARVCNIDWVKVFQEL